MKLGVARADITPPVGVTLMGYGRRPSESVGHSLRAEALACEGKDGSWILICADVCAFSSPLANMVRAAIGSSTGLLPEAVMLTATHTHSGPYVTDALWSEHSELESSYFKDLHDKLVTVAEQAWRERSPGVLAYANTSAPELGSNRRVQEADGTWTNEWSDPEGRHTGYFDPAVELVGVLRENNSLQVLLVNFGCHPVCFGSQNRAISGDYVSYLKDCLEADGKADTVLFTVSGHGNVDPLTCVQADMEPVRSMGIMLAEIVSQALPSLARIDDDGVAAVYEHWKFNTTWKLAGRRLKFYPHAAQGTPVSTGVSALAAGELVLLGLPGEAVSEYREKLRRRSPFAHTLMISLANDFVGYLPTDEIQKQGAYEAELSPLDPIEESLTCRADAALSRAYNALRS